jgi:hypothetical protein
MAARVIGEGITHTKNFARNSPMFEQRSYLVMAILSTFKAIESSWRFRRLQCRAFNRTRSIENDCYLDGHEVRRRTWRADARDKENGILYRKFQLGLTKDISHLFRTRRLPLT